jgi:DNA modification methylase
LTELGIQQVWCLVPKDSLTEEDRDRVGLQSNILEGSWDFEKLANNFDVELLLTQGFTRLELDVDQTHEDDFNTEDELKSIQTPVCQSGDLFQLGEHRLIVGNSVDQDMVDRLMEGKIARVIFTSPPYNMAAGLYGKEYHDDLSREEYIAMNLAVINNWSRYLKGFIFWNISYNKNARDEFIEVMYRILKDTQMRFLELIVWNKKHALPITSKGMLTRQYEDILLAADKDTMKEDIELYFAGTNEKRAIFNKKTGKSVSNYWEIGTNKSQQADILACFPVELPGRAMQLMTERGDIVLEPFFGAGTTMVAAQQLGRICYGAELTPKFADLAIRRFQRNFPEMETKCLTRDIDMQLFNG